MAPAGIIHFVTVCAGNFAPQLFALHMSISRHITDFKLHVICVDDQIRHILEHFKLKNIIIHSEMDYMDTELEDLKEQRTFGEFCWTITPTSILTVFKSDCSINKVTYVDADCYLMSQPYKLFEFFDNSGKSVLISPHYFDATEDQSHVAGKYCVQWVSVSRAGLHVIEEWDKKCREWCYNRFEDGKFGDQKYLDYWLKDHSSYVIEVDNPTYMVAPWNINVYAYSNAIMYHFHGVRIIKKNKFYLGSYVIPYEVKQNLYYDYLVELKGFMEQLTTAGFELQPQIEIHIYKLFFDKIYTLIRRAFRYIRVRLSLDVMKIH